MPFKMSRQTLFDGRFVEFTPFFFRYVEYKLDSVVSLVSRGPLDFVKKIYRERTI